MKTDPKIRNDTDMSYDEAIAYLKRRGTVEIRYGDLLMTAERGILEDARKYVASLAEEDRRGVMLSVDRALRRALPKITSGRFSKKIADNFHSDLILWEALKGTTAA